jgi:uncharacterized membrane protein YhaH (DUF805 family)
VDALGNIGLIIVLFHTAVISVVTGGTSLITVPVMMQCGVEPQVAVATDMLALAFLSLGRTVPFIKSRALRDRRLPWLVALTLVGSALGAMLLVLVPPRTMPLIVSVAMIVVAAFSLADRNAGLSEDADGVSRTMVVLGYVSTFVLGIYGGFFSGGRNHAHHPHQAPALVDRPGGVRGCVADLGRGVGFLHDDAGRRGLPPVCGCCKAPASASPTPEAAGPAMARQHVPARTGDVCPDAPGCECRSQAPTAPEPKPGQRTTVERSDPGRDAALGWLDFDAAPRLMTFSVPATAGPPRKLPIYLRNSRLLI